MGDGIVKEVYEILKEFKGVEHIDYIKLSHHGAKIIMKELRNL